MLESKGLKVNISKTKVMRYAQDGVLKEQQWIYVATG